MRVTVSGCDCDRVLYMDPRRATTRPSPGSDLGREEFYRFAFLKLGMGLLDSKSNLHFFQTSDRVIHAKSLVIRVRMYLLK